MVIGADVKAKTTKQGQVDCRYVSKGTKTIAPSNGNCYRIKESVASTVKELNTEFSLTGTKGAGSGDTINYSKFYFNGIPDGKYSLASKKGIMSTIVEFLADIIDYLIGILTYIVRMVFVGWTAIFDNILNWTAETILDTGDTPPEEDINSVESKRTETEDRKLTIETLLFNEFEVLDINIFDF